MGARREANGPVGPDLRGGHGTGWTAAAERGSALGIRLMAWAHRRLGRRTTGVLLHPVVAYFLVTAGEARRASRLYFRRLAAHLPHRTPARPAAGHTFRHLHTFATLLLDRLSLWTGRYADFEVRIHGREAMEGLVRERRGALLLGAHLGSFDLLRVIARDADIRVSVVMFTGNARRINDLLGRLDPGSTLRIIELDPDSVRAGFEIRRRLARGEFVALLADRLPPGAPHPATRPGGDGAAPRRARVAHARFLGTEAPFPLGPFLLPVLLRVPAVLCVALARAPGRYDVHLERLAEPEAAPGQPREQAAAALVARFAERLEHYVALAPYQWFNFYDFWAAEPGA